MQTTITIEGQHYTIVRNANGTHAGDTATIGEVQLLGARSADYRSVRANDERTFFFARNTEKGLPTLPFDQQRFIVDGDTLRPATRGEVLADREI